MAERGVRSRRRQPPGAGLLGYEVDRRVLHPGAGDAADQDARPAERPGPALLLRHGRRQRARVLLVPRRPRRGARRLRAGNRAGHRRVDQRGRLDESCRVQRARGAVPRVPGQAQGQGHPGQPHHGSRRQRVRRGQGTAPRGVRALVLLPGPGRHPARVRLLAAGHGPAWRRSARAEDSGRPDRRPGLALLSLIHVLEWRAAIHPGAIALSDQQGAELTYAGLAAAVERSAAGFAATGIAPGDVVPVIATNQAGWVTAMLGLIRAGALPAAVNWRLAAPEVATLLRLADPAAVLTDADCAVLTRQAVSGLDRPR